MKILPFAALTLAPLAFATAAVNPAIVPADSRWLIYLDLNALRTTSPGKEIVAYAEQQRENVGGAAVGIDFQKVLATVGSVTAFGSNLTSDPKALDGAIVLQGTPDLRKIIEGLVVQQTVTNPDSASEIKDLPFTAYGLRSPQHRPANDKDSDAAPNQSELIVAFPPEPIVIVSKSRAQILNARAAFNGSIPTIARSSSAPLKELLANADAAYLFASSVVPSEQYFPADQPQARILRMTTSGAVSIGQRGNNTYAHVVLVSANDDSADKLTKILQGITAMLSLAETNDRQLADFLNSTKVERTNHIVTLDLAYASDRLGQMVKTMINEPPSHRHGPPMMHGGHEPHVSGEVVGQWQAEAGKTAAGSHTIENVKIENGAVIALERQSNGGKSVRFDRVEITPATGGAPLIFRTDLMRTTGGPRGQTVLFEFPGADGVYTLKTTYANDPDGKATYTVTVRQPKSETESASKPAPEESAATPKDSE